MACAGSHSWVQEWPAITALRTDVEAFAGAFPTIGFDEATMRYK